jgi:hypothetical protein
MYHYALKTWAERRAITLLFITPQYFMEVSGRLKAPAALILG